jgi:hypothetical protein
LIVVLDPKAAGDLRGMVREVLREALANRPPSGTARTETVRLANDNDLQAFIARIVEPGTLDAIRIGKLRFTLANASGGAVPSGALDGVVTEQRIDRLAGTSTLVLAPGAVLTPLARDRARRLGLKIERRR